MQRKRFKKVYSQQEFVARIKNLCKWANKRGRLRVCTDDGKMFALVGLKQYRQLQVFQNSLFDLSNQSLDNQTNA